MSQWLRHSLKELEAVEQKLRRTQYLYKSTPLAAENNNRIASLYTCWVAIMYEYSTLRCGPSQLAIGRITSNLQRMDVWALLTSCKNAYTWIIQSIEVGYPNNYASFKRLLRQDGTDALLIGEFKGLIAQVLDSPEPESLRTLCTLLLFPTKVNLELDSLREEAQKAYVDTEKDFFQGTPTPEEATVLSRWFPREASTYLYDVLSGHHGSGSVAEGYGSISDKYRKWLNEDQLMHYVTQKCGHFSGDDLVRRGLERTARVTFVPKSFDKYRTIAMEPCGAMFWEEGLFKAITTNYHFYDVPFPFSTFARIYNPSTQEPNRAAALRGSLDGSIATIDLKAASDSIGMVHVKHWFRKTCLYEWLIATRSPEALLPDGCKLQLKKYASMGNATTFLVETAAFAAITECAIVELGGDPHRVRWGVYGDDIFVETKYALGVIQRLEQNGFLVNKDKTLLWGATGFFRESCGVNALNGVDVTPLRCSRKFEDLSLVTQCGRNHNPTSPSTITAAIDLANQAFEHGWRLLREYIVLKLLQLPQKFRPAFGDAKTEGVLWSTQPENHHLNWRWNVDLQEWEIQHGVVKMKKQHNRDDLVDFYEFLRSSHFREQVVEPVLVDTTGRRGCTYWAPKWTPVSHLTSSWGRLSNPPTFNK